MTVNPALVALGCIYSETALKIVSIGLPPVVNQEFTPFRLFPFEAMPRALLFWGPCSRVWKRYARICRGLGHRQRKADSVRDGGTGAGDRQRVGSGGRTRALGRIHGGRSWW